MNKNMLILYL